MGGDHGWVVDQMSKTNHATEELSNTQMTRAGGQNKDAGRKEEIDMSAL